MILRVAHIITQLELGGAQRNTLYTVSHLDPQHYQPVLICGPGGILDKEAKAGSWSTHFVPWLVRPVRPWKDAVAILSLYKWLRQSKPQIVHTHSSKAGILGRLAAYLAGVPVIIHTYHGFGFNNQQKPWTRWLFVNVEKACAHISTHLVFVSDENRKEAAHLKIGKKIPKSLIRSGIQLKPEFISKSDSRPAKDHKSRDSRGVREKLGIPKEAWVVTYVGNFKPQKNPLDLVQVAARVPFHFLLVGDGELLSDAKELVKSLGIQDRVHFLGWQKRRDDVQNILNESNCFLMTSLWEGLPRALVEAFAASKPAVAYGIDGVRDILLDEETGFLIPPGNIELAAEKLVWLADNPLKAVKMGQKGCDLISKEFDIDTMVRQQENLYQSLYDSVPLKNYYEPMWDSPSKT